MTATDPVKDARAAALPDTLEWPDGEPRSRSKAIAYAALFKAWGADRQGADACRQAEGLGLRCRTARGGLDELRQFNRPAVLQMRDAQGRNRGQEYFATLTGLDDKTATFTIGTESRTIALGALAAQWSGQYTLLWRMPPDAPRTTRPGERGPAVEWLRRQLAQVQGRVEPATDPVFDDALAHHLKQFQLARGLAPDGTLGPQTLMRLSGVADKTAPKLLHEQGGK
jgi:general secretion pathway protein A